ncbi:MAG: DUF4398 domain-containing protein [Syntrophorhabdus sp.]
MFFIIFSGCSSNNVKSIDSLARAEAAVDSAQKAEAWTYAPLEMKIAQDKIAEARTAAHKDRDIKASRLADQAAVDARLAEKKADAEKARRASRQMRDTINALRESSGLAPE